MYLIFDFMHNRKNKLSIYLIIAILLVANCYLLINLLRSGKNLTAKQSHSFSHKMHSKYNITCLSCHYQAETNSLANLPSTKDCLMCHVALKTESELLRSIINSYDSLISLVYLKVYDLPDYVKFSHSTHINSGIDCATCHGYVDQMDSVYQVRDLTMAWCVKCHRKPELYTISPREISGIFYQPEIFEKNGKPTYGSFNIYTFVQPRKMKPAPTECSTCHF